MGDSESATSGPAGRRRSSRSSHRPRHHGGYSSSDCGNNPNDQLLPRDEVIQVDVMAGHPSSEEQWGENTTCVTGNTSERSLSYEDVYAQRGSGTGGLMSSEKPSWGARVRCGAWLGTLFSSLISLVAFLSPIAMVAIPKISFLDPDWNTTSCDADCEGLLISFSFKMLILFVGIWALFFRRSLAYLPRVFVYRAVLLALVFLMTFAYWLFYGVRILGRREAKYTTIVTFALSSVDALLFIHYLAVILLEIRHLRPEYKIRVIRSPDGESRTYSLGQMSVQRAAMFILDNYYRDFPVYNQFLNRPPVSSRSSGGGGHRKSSSGAGGGGASFKVYDVDGPPGVTAPAINPGAIMAAAARKRDSAHNERFYEELEWERRMRKRKARLITAAEEAFMHVKRLADEKGPCVPMDAHEAAQAVFPSLSRALQKYLRTTRQQPRHTAPQVVDHLRMCLTYDLAPRAFLERFFSTQETHEASQLESKWSIVSCQLVSSPLSHGKVFQLRCNSNGPEAGVQLMITVTRLPFYDLTETLINPKKDQFVLRLSSETSV